MLRVSPEIVLEQTISLPLAAERDLTGLLSFDLERLTPFSASEVVWNYVVQQRDRQRARLKLRLTIVPLVALEPMLSRLAGLNLVPKLIEVVMSDGIRVLKLQQKAEARRSRSPMAMLIIPLLLIFAICPFVAEFSRLRGLQSSIDAMAPGVAQAHDLLRRVLSTNDSRKLLANEAKRVGSTLEALAVLTKVFPDDSYLTSFNMRDRKMSFSGLAASAPGIINRLAENLRVHDPAFTAAVTKTGTTQMDVFSIKAELAP